MRFLKKILLLISLLVVVVLALLVGMPIVDRQDDYAVDLDGVVLPRYVKSTITFNQGNDSSKTLPFLASAIIDTNGDGTEELFLGGGPDTPDGFFTFKDQTLQPVAVEGVTKGAVASFGSVVLDVNKDGKDDLLVAREDGLWLHLNTGKGFTTQKLNARMPEDTVPLSIAVADLNRDGAFDMYVAGYIRNDLVEGQTTFREGYGGSSHFFINDGENTSTDVTDKSGITYKHNTFQAAFIDIDRDGNEDLVVAHDTGHVLTWRNRGNVQFERMANPNSKQYSYPMGLGITDLGNDGLPDFFFSNVGSTAPDFMVRGDLTDQQVSNWKWILFKNKGNFTFDDVAEPMKIADYEFSWGGVFEDLNLDGLEDLIVAENYIGLPTHKIPFLLLNGRLLLQKSTGEFAPAEKAAGVINRAYSISPLSADFNGDGLPDIVHANLNGNSALFLSQADGKTAAKQQYIKVQLPNTVQSIAATVTVSLSNGKTLSRPYVSGEGLCSDSSHIIVFGLGDATATAVNLSYINGQTAQKMGNYKNELVRF